MIEAEELTYNRYYKLINDATPDMPEPSKVSKAKAYTADWMRRRAGNEGERAKTDYDIWGNV